MAVGVPVGDEVVEDVVLGDSLGVAVLGVVDVALGFGVRVALGSGRDVLRSVGEGSALGATAAGGGGGRTSR